MRRLFAAACAAVGLVVLGAWAKQPSQPGDGFTMRQGKQIVGLRTTPPRLKKMPVVQRVTPKDVDRAIEFTEPKGQVAKAKAKPTLPFGTNRQLSSTDFTFFRRTTVYSGGSSDHVNEPSLGNDRNDILFTANKYAVVSQDNGKTFTSFINPYDTTVFPSADGGFCCDQLVNASDEDDNELIAWLMQYNDDGSEDTLRIATYAGKDGLDLHLDEQAASTPVTAVCLYDFQPSDLGLPSDRMFDFNQLENSDKYLYVTSNIFKTSNGASKGYAMIRIKLSALTGSCGSLSSSEWDYWVDSNDFSGTLVQGAGSTMWWAVHKDGNTLQLLWLTDSGTTISHKDRTITLYKQIDRDSTSKDANCVVGSKDPCGRFDDRITTGWYADGKVGWLWTARQAGDYNYPYIQGAIFKTSDRSLSSEPIIWNDDYAWAMPSVGVNSDGKVGGVMYLMGGSRYPTAYAFIVDSWSSLSPHQIAASTTAPSSDEWGDYGRTVRYDGCSKTWQAATYTVTTTGTWNATDTFSWFGDKDDGCPDLVASVTSVSQTSTTLSIGNAIVNNGSATADASTTRFYLSRDQELSSRDTQLTDKSVASLAQDGTVTSSVSASIPSGVGGDYYVIACADEADVVSEVTNTNNCGASASSIDIPFHPSVPVPQEMDVILSGIVNGPANAKPGASFPLGFIARQFGPAQTAAAGRVKIYLSVVRHVDPSSVFLLTNPLDSWKPIEIPPDHIPKPTPENPKPVAPLAFAQTQQLTITIPKSIAPGRYYVVVCAAQSAEQADDPIARNDCVATKQRVQIRVTP